MKTITLTEQDVILASKLNLLKNPNYKRFRAVRPWRWLLMLTGVGLCILSHYLDRTTCYRITSNIIFFIGYILFLSAVLVFITVFLTKLRTKQTWKQDKILHEPYTLTWNDDSLFIASHYIKSEVKWCAYCHMVQDDSYLLIYQQRHLFMIIPKHCFEHPDEQQDFLTHLEAGIAKNKAN